MPCMNALTCPETELCSLAWKYKFPTITLV